MLKVLLWLLVGLFGLLAAFVLIAVISSLFISYKKEYLKDSRWNRFLVDSIVAIFLKLCRVRVHIFAEELVPRRGRFLFVCNHQSLFDPFIALRLLKRYHLAFISKPENFKIPILGKLVHRSCFLPIDRENPRNAIKTIRLAAERIKTGNVSMGVYPEGTRSKSGELLAFHNGVFKIAQQADVPIVVAVVKGTEKIAKNYPWHATTVQMQILTTIPASSIVGRPTAEIGSEVRQLMLQALGEEDAGRQTGERVMEN